MSVQFGSVVALSRRRRRRNQYLMTFAGINLCTLMLFAGILLFRSNSVASKNVRIEPQLDAPLGTILLYVSNGDVEKGTRLTAANFRKVPWPRDSVPEGSAISIDEVENMYALDDLTDSLPIRLSALSKTSPNFGIEENLPPGYRALGINVTATTSVESRASAGSHVDVLVTYIDPKDGQITTKLVAENAIVLSLGGEASVPERDDGTKSSSDMQVSTATLGVPFSDTLRIQTALALGRLSLVLRAKTDVVTPEKNTFRGKDFEERPEQRQLGRRAPKSGGTVKFTGPNGEEQEMQLSGSDWHHSNLNKLY